MVSIRGPSWNPGKGDETKIFKPSAGSMPNSHGDYGHGLIDIGHAIQ